MTTRLVNHRRLDLPPTRAGTVPVSLASVENDIASWMKKPVEERCRLVHERLDRCVVPFDVLAANPVPPGESDRLRLMFTHVPRTAGTALETIIAKNYSFKDLIHINAPIFLRNPKALFKKAELPVAIMGHHQLSDPVYSFFEGPVAHITILREPVDRFLSYYSYVRSDPEHPLHARVRSMTITEFLDAPESIEIRNGQTLRLAGYLHDEALDRDIDHDACLALAIKNLERRFTLVGTTARFVEFLLACGHLLGWRDIYHKPVNQASGRLSWESMTEADLHDIRARNECDSAIYEIAAAIAAHQAAQIGLNDDAVNAFSRRNRAHRDLVESRSHCESS